MANRKAERQFKERPGNEVASSGIPELDSILRGGFPRERMCLIAGAPGSGKTTLALQFLLAGTQKGEKAAYITFSETAVELKQSAKSHGWSLSSISILDFTKMKSELGVDEQYTVLHPADVELAETSTNLLDKIKKLKPQRLVLDSLSELRMVARDPLRYRRQILALKQAFSQLGCTVLFLDDQTGDAGADLLLQSIAHGVIHLTSAESRHGGLHRAIKVTKMRGVSFAEGSHDFRIATGGVKVFPRLPASSETKLTDDFSDMPPLSTGIPELDNLIGAPIPWGSSVMIVGPPGIGKSSLAAQLATVAAARGKRVCMYSSEESLTSLLRRCERIGIKLPEAVAKSNVALRRIDPTHITPGQVTYEISKCIDDTQGGMVVIDSLNGYLQAMSSDGAFVIHLHELLAYLNSKGIITVLVSVQRGFVDAEQTNFEATYLADLVILLRYFEAQGSVRQAISVVKNRSDEHERVIREFEVNSKGIRIGAPLRQFEGVLTGRPKFSGDVGTLIREQDESE
jgi:circadian clock protein KaiC